MDLLSENGAIFPKTHNQGLELTIFRYSDVQQLSTFLFVPAPRLSPCFLFTKMEAEEILSQYGVLNKLRW